MLGRPIRRTATLCAALSLGFIVPEQTLVTLNAPVEGQENSVPQPYARTMIELRDFRDQEIRAAGFTLLRDMTIRVNALGGGDKSSWRGFVDDDDPQMYAAGWIIDAETRDLVWEMTFQNSSGRSDNRKFDGDVKLPRGSYEVYFSAHGFDHRSSFSNFSMNIDRREARKKPSGIGGGLLKIFGLGREDWYEDFMKLAKDWGITVSVPDGETSSFVRFDAPMQNQRAMFTAYNLGDREYLKKALTVTNDITVRIVAQGEGRRKDGMFDYGWIVRSDTRERVWEMVWNNTDYAGGALKNRLFEGDVKLAKGMYELYYITDDSHSSEDWNAKPPYDPFRYGVSVELRRDADKNALIVSEAEPMEKNVIVSLVRVRDNDFVSAGFSLKQETKLHVYALAEQVDRDDPADYGWIVNAKTREKVWTMERRRMYHAGGAAKNKMVDELVTLPKGDYIAYYQTDGSHAYNDWNSDPPYDEEHWGITIMGLGEKFDPRAVGTFSEENEEDVLVQIIKVRDDERLRKRFTITKPTKVRVYALGEGQDRQMFDYGWIEDAKSRKIVWEMTYKMTDHAGGARKNRMVSTTIT
ncbi:MAG: hypothetical protein ACRDGA_06770, partial [Bacteroidota bacterium]